MAQAPISFSTILTNIEKYINLGLTLAGPIIGTFKPTYGPILLEIAQVIGAIETSLAQSLPPATGVAPAAGMAYGMTVEERANLQATLDSQAAQIIQAIATVQALKQYAAK
jgi:hypothetical protein